MGSGAAWGWQQWLANVTQVSAQLRPSIISRKESGLRGVSLLTASNNLRFITGWRRNCWNWGILWSSWCMSDIFHYRKLNIDLFGFWKDRKKQKSFRYNKFPLCFCPLHLTFIVVGREAWCHKTGADHWVTTAHGQQQLQHHCRGQWGSCSMRLGNSHQVNISPQPEF